jgi:hypothetical protein
LLSCISTVAHLPKRSLIGARKIPTERECAGEFCDLIERLP